MISAGTASIKTLDDGWTVVTADGSLSAHFEHTVAITVEGPRVLTGEGGVPVDGLGGS
jgi:methionyl aminopeptidase